MSININGKLLKIACKNYRVFGSVRFFIFIFATLTRGPEYFIVNCDFSDYNRVLITL